MLEGGGVQLRAKVSLEHPAGLWSGTRVKGARCSTEHAVYTLAVSRYGCFREGVESGYGDCGRVLINFCRNAAPGVRTPGAAPACLGSCSVSLRTHTIEVCIIEACELLKRGSIKQRQGKFELSHQRLAWMAWGK